ncbi:carboxymuconolactone decarboxylase family protein [Roseibium salinum]|uniref:Carboxymuconolactone decarboxylase family protein n=1 Tax=Roseibium salinum TaxID=1604349 RepID=A0ABT3R6C0_9HYPH|nr:carboxymuconolactone decarboxylase family protein [Roseibium sp. DSM 29163]MCX2724708.1 carboxymuconolactone decarboxylase family protein [Roseibium sp. DSM 29163]MDN3721301.1 carboxymuconolactone decarboxylase family protein [Roseibium salinum]
MTTSNPVKFYELVPAIVKRFVSAAEEIGNAEIEPKLRHLVDLRASQMNQCAFCVKMHTKEALEDGESHERIQRLTVWRHVNDYTPAEKVALAWTEALTNLHVETDYGRLREDLRKHFNDAQISAITAAVAMINVWNRVQVSNH